MRRGTVPEGVEKRKRRAANSVSTAWPCPLVPAKIRVVGTSRRCPTNNKRAAGQSFSALARDKVPYRQKRGQMT